MNCTMTESELDMPVAFEIPEESVVSSPGGRSCQFAVNPEPAGGSILFLISLFSSSLLPEDCTYLLQD